MAADPPDLHFTTPGDPALAASDTARPASPRTRAAFEAARPFATVFPPGTRVDAASSVDPDSFGATSMVVPPLVELNTGIHPGQLDSDRRAATTAQTALHELVVHAAPDTRTAARGARYEAASTQHRRMFFAPERDAPGSYLDRTRAMVRGAPTEARQRGHIDDWYRDVTREIEDPANQRRATPQRIEGARRWARRRRGSMEDAVSPAPAREHEW